MSQFETSEWTMVAVRQSQAFRRPNGRVSIGLWTKELGPIAFDVDQQAIGALRGNLRDAERLLRQKVGRA
jgi:hypothetical protein